MSMTEDQLLTEIIKAGFYVGINNKGDLFFKVNGGPIGEFRSYFGGMADYNKDPNHRVTNPRYIDLPNWGVYNREAENVILKLKPRKDFRQMRTWNGNLKYLYVLETLLQWRLKR